MVRSLVLIADNYYWPEFLTFPFLSSLSLLVLLPTSQSNNKYHESSWTNTNFPSMYNEETKIPGRIELSPFSECALNMNHLIRSKVRIVGDEQLGVVPAISAR